MEPLGHPRPLSSGYPHPETGGGGHYEPRPVARAARQPSSCRMASHRGLRGRGGPQPISGPPAPGGPVPMATTEAFLFRGRRESGAGFVDRAHSAPTRRTPAGDRCRRGSVQPPISGLWFHCAIDVVSSYHQPMVHPGLQRPAHPPDRNGSLPRASPPRGFKSLSPALGWVSSAGDYRRP